MSLAALTAAANRLAAGSPEAGPSQPTELLVAVGIEKSFRRGMRPFAQRAVVLRGADLTLQPG